MNEVTEVGAAAKGKGDKKAAGAGMAKAGGAGKGKNKAAGDGNAKVEGQIGRMLVRAIWAQEWSQANPDGQAEQRKAAWKETREAAMERNLKPYRRAINALSRSGVAMTLSETAAKANDEDDGSED